ncbi:MAG: hypothetical protein HKN21_13845 [Candidatus Eisenbacteria bacterium]|uniref:Quinol:cytochrome C oxidoreductase n=1 Tax=Eiseniibacteriota bacterium TaxID=2212470 RepID=A0A7Y2E9S5_UNCEI|nr:hypothetical protein [Candidatus Eisenbacteria bacterium]
MSSMDITDRIRVPAGAWGGKISRLFMVAVVALVLCAVGFVVDREQFYFSWLTAMVFGVSISVASLFFVMLHHLTRASWSTVIRRIAEALMSPLPLLVLFFLPVILGNHDLYHWTHHDAVEHDAILKHKAPYLNVTFWVIRAAVYFLIWTLMTRYFYSNSVKQDQSADPNTTVTMQRRSAPGMILFALTITFMGFDWLMSLDPHWFSTIFGVYIFAGSALACFGTLTLAALALRRGGYLETVIRDDHIRDLGRLMFAFSVFWAYIAFSQFFLIWYGNIPEETLYYIHRFEGSWKYLTFGLAIGHFIVPFMILMSQWSKRRPALIGFMAVWVLVMHYLDLYWMVMPTHHKEGIHFSWIDLVCLVAVCTILVALFVRKLSQNPLVPVGDPRLPESLRLHNDY